MSERVDAEMLDTIIKDRGERAMCPRHVEDCLIELKFLRRMEQEVREAMKKMQAPIPDFRDEFREGYQLATDGWLELLQEVIEGVDDELLAMSIDE